MHRTSLTRLFKQEVYYGDSYYNQHEAQLVVELILMLLDRGCRGEEIGVIALYKKQELKISELLLQRTGAVPPAHQSQSQDTEDDVPRDSALKLVQVSTVDAFQGAEKGNVQIRQCQRSSLSRQRSSSCRLLELTNWASQTVPTD